MSSTAVCLDHIQYECMCANICVITVASRLYFMNASNCFYALTPSGSHADGHTPPPAFRVRFGSIATKICKQIHPLAYRQYACVQVCVFSCVDWIASVSSLFSLTVHGNKPSLFLMIYPSYVLEKPPGMPLQRFVLFDWAGGLEDTDEVWQGNGMGQRGMMGRGWAWPARAQEVWEFLM